MAQQIGLEAILETDRWQKGVKTYLTGLDKMQKETSGFDSKMAAFGKKGIDSLQTLGKVALGASVAIAAAGAAAGLAIGKFVVSGISKAADLESQMSRIAATLNTTREAAAPLKDLIMQLALDPKLVVTTNEAADAIENLAKNGVSMKDILDGVARSVVLLANSTGAEFGAAADVVTDVMAQFNLTAQDTEHAVNQITGVTNLSKLTFDDYRLAIAQAGGAAGTLGVSFEDFNSVLIATNANFASGSDLGTSFKNFLTTLPGKSDKAKEAIAALGLEFFDAQGNMRSMAEISEELNQAFMNEVTFSTQVSNMTAEQTAQKKALEQQLARTGTQLFLYQAGVNGVGESEEANAESVAKLNQQYNAAMTAYEGLAGSMGTTVTTRRKLTEEEKIAYAQAIFGVDSMRLAFGMAEAGAVAYTDMATATKALGLEGKQLQVAQESLNQAFADGKITFFEFGTAQAAAIDASAQAAERMRNFKGVMDILGGAIEGLQIMIGDAFLPILTVLAQKAVELTSAYGPALVKPFQDFGQAISTFFSQIEQGREPFDAFIMAMSTFGPQGTAIAASMSGIALAVGGVVFAIGMVLQPITDAIGKFVEWKDVAIVLGGAVATVVVPAIWSMIAAMTPFLLIIGGAVLAVAAVRTAWESDWLGIQTKTTEAISAITTALEPFTTTIQTHMQGALAEVQAFASGNETEWTNVKAIWDSVKISASNLFLLIGGAAALALPLLKEKIDELVVAFPPLKEAIDTATTAITAAKDALVPFVTAITNLDSTYETFKGTIKKYEGDFKALTTVIEGNEKAIGKMNDALGEFQTDVKKLDFSEFIKEVGLIGKTFEAMWGTVRPILLGFGALVGAVMGVQSILSLNLFSRVLSNTGEAFQIVIDGMTETLRGIREAWQGTFDFINGLITGDFPAAWQGLKDSFSGAMLTISAVFGTAWSLITLGFQTLKETIIGFLEDAGITEAANTTWNNIKTAWQTAKDTLANVWQTIIQTVKDKISKPSPSWKTQGQDVIANVRDGIGQMAGAIWNKITEIVNGIITRFKNAINKVKQIGKDIIQGLIDGLAAMKQALIDKVTEMANAIPQWMKDALGIGSPSKVMIAIGKDTMRGFLVGLETGSVRLVEMAEQITRTFTNTILKGTERAVDAFANILDGWSSAGSGFADSMQEALDSVTESFNNMLATGTGTGAQQFDMIRLMDQLQSGIGKYQQNNRVLDTLKQQAELIDLIRETGGQPATVLAGIALGRDADPQQLLDVVNRMMEVFNGRLEKSILIASQGFQELVDSLRKNRRSLEQIEAQFADAKLDQLERYKREVTRLDEQIAAKEQSILVTGDTSELYHIQSLNTLRERTLDSIKRFLEQRQQIEAKLAQMPTFRGERAQAGADAFRERFIDPLVAGFDQMSVEMRSSTLTQIDRYLGMLREFSAWMDHAAAAEKHARKAIEGFGEGAQQRIENLLAIIYDVGTPTASRANAIQSLREFAATLNTIRSELTTRTAGREDVASVIERATGGFDQLSAYKTALADLDKQIATLTNTIEETGNVNLLPQLRSFDTKRQLSVDELKNFLVQVSQLEGAFRDIKNLTGPGETSAQRFVDEQIQPILDAFSAPMRPQERQVWLYAAQQRVAIVNKFIDQMRAVEKLQQRIATQEGFAHLADEFASMTDIAMPEAQRVALLNQLTLYITQMERLFALQKDIAVGVGADPLVERFKNERLDTIAKQLENINLSEAERLRLIEQYRMEQEKILAIQTKQNQLEFLQQQLSLLDKLKQLGTEEGFKVDVPNIIKGIGFGVNASLDDLLLLVGKVIDETVRFTNFKLGIKSPSKVFAEIGGYMMQGLAKGIESTMMRPINSLSGAISELPYALGGRSLTLNMGGVNISNGMDEVMFEARVRQILDRAFP